MRQPVRSLLAAAVMCACASAASFAVQAQNQDINPRVDTSASPPADTAPAPTSAKPAAGTKPVATRTPAVPAAANAAPAAPAATKGKGKALDRLELDTTQITGNRELPKVLYIVPWKRADLGDLVGKPVNSLLDEVLTPVDRDVFQRENRYYRALTTQGGSAPANGTATSPGSDGASATSPPRNER